MSVPRGKCIICERDEVWILSRGHCNACYPIGKKFNWDIKMTKEYRKQHPLREYNKKQNGNIHTAIKPKRKYTKKIKLIPPSSPAESFPRKNIPPASKVIGGFSEIIVRAFAAIEAKEKVYSILCLQIRELEQKLIATKQDLIKSRYEVRTLMREKLTSVEIDEELQ